MKSALPLPLDSKTRFTGLDLPPLPAYKPTSHTAALFIVEQEVRRCEQAVGGDVDFFVAKKANLLRSESVLLAHRSWLALGWRRFLPWNLLRLAAALD